MKRWIWRLIVLAALAALGVWLLRDSEPWEPADSPPPEKPVTRLPAPEPPSVTTLPVAESASALNSPGQSAEDDLAHLDLLFSQYRQTFGGNPVGENDEITAALLGGNPKRLAWLPPSGRFLDSSGHLIDRWGTPYFFHAISGNRMEIVSAGPDRKLHTPDDLKSQP